MRAYNLGPGTYRVTVTVTRLVSADGQRGGRVELGRLSDGLIYWPLTTFVGKVDCHTYRRAFSLVLLEAQSFDVVQTDHEGEPVDFRFDITFEHDPLAGIAELPFDRSPPTHMRPTREDIALQLLAGYVGTVLDWTATSAQVRVDRCFELADEVIRRRDR